MANIAMRALVSASLFMASTSFAATINRPTRVDVPANFQFQKSNIEIPAAHDYTAPANLYIPQTRSNEKLPAVLLQYGAQGDKDVDYIVEIAEGLAKRGFAVMIMEMTGRGSRTETSPEPESNEELIRWYMDDYAMAVTYLSKLPNIDKTRISYAGTSLGAITGIPFCAEDHRVHSCISIVGGGSAFSSLPEELDCVKAVGKIAPRATMLVNGTLDPVIPIFWSQNLHRHVKRPYVKVWYSSDHYLRTIDKDDLYDRMTVFLKKY